VLVIGGIQQIAGRKGHKLRSTFTEEQALDFKETEVIWGRVLKEGRDLGSSMSMPSPTRAPTTKQPTTRPPTSPPTTSGGGGTLLAIGDSLCAGHLPEPKNTIVFSDEAYVDTLYEYLEDEYDFDELVKVCCTGEDSSELIDASYSVPPSDGSICYDNPETPPSQLDAAVTALQSGTVRLMTISIGANDVLSCIFAPDPQLCVATQIEALVVNLLTILTTLLDATESMPPIVAMTPYNPFLAFFLSQDENEQALVPLSQQLSKFQPVIYSFQ
jgi:lysophospholipase L1-like esterase